MLEPGMPGYGGQPTSTYTGGGTFTGVPVGATVAQGGYFTPGSSTPTPYTPGNFQTQTPSTAGGAYLTDPGYVAAHTAEQLGIPQINTSLQDEITRALINFGDPSFAQQAGFGLDPQSAAFAQQNYLSGNAALARLDKAHQQARQAVVNQLAGHGILNSGDLGYQEGQADQSYGNNVYDAQQSVLDAINGYQQTAVQQKQALQDQVNQSLSQAWTNYINNPSAYTALTQQPATITPTTAVKPPTVPKAAKPSAASTASAALLARSQALNKKYGLG